MCCRSCDEATTALADNWDVPQGPEAQRKHPIPHEIVTMHTNLKGALAEALMSHLVATGDWLGHEPHGSEVGSQPGAERAPRGGWASSMPWATALTVLTKVPGFSWVQRDPDQVPAAGFSTHLTLNPQTCTASYCSSRPPRGANNNFLIHVQLRRWR